MTKAWMYFSGSIFILTFICSIIGTTLVFQSFSMKTNIESNQIIESNSYENITITYHGSRHLEDSSEANKSFTIKNNNPHKITYSIIWSKIKNGNNYLYDINCTDNESKTAINIIDNKQTLDLDSNLEKTCYINLYHKSDILENEENILFSGEYKIIIE